jgi:integrase/recombinase XerD
MGAPSKHKIYTEFYQEQAVNYKKHLDILGLNPETTQARYLYLREFLVI